MATKKKPISASEIKTRAQFEKAVREGRPIRFDGGYPTSGGSRKTSKKRK